MIINALQTGTPFVEEIFRIVYCIRGNCTSGGPRQLYHPSISYSLVITTEEIFIEVPRTEYSRQSGQKNLNICQNRNLKQTPADPVVCEPYEPHFLQYCFKNSVTAEDSNN